MLINESINYFLEIYAESTYFQQEHKVWGHEKHWWWENSLSKAFVKEVIEHVSFFMCLLFWLEEA